MFIFSPKLLILTCFKCKILQTLCRIKCMLKTCHYWYFGGKWKHQEKGKSNKNRRIFYPYKNLWGSKKIPVWKHVPEGIKLQISFQYPMSEKKGNICSQKLLVNKPKSIELPSTRRTIKRLHLEELLTRLFCNNDEIPKLPVFLHKSNCHYTNISKRYNKL